MQALARCWWLMPVILVTQEAEIRRIVVQSQPGQIVVHETLSQKKKNHKKVWWHGLSGTVPVFCLFVCLFMAVLGFELRAWHLQSRCSTASATQPCSLINNTFHLKQTPPA
jgi:hypothetical protein